ncbi:zinc ribbon domain-containing protein [Orbaceae bacterium ESL0727]|nr:zinc ribbon domain-containing protein [Orbaceae bacterium ESL0727]
MTRQPNLADAQLAICPKCHQKMRQLSPQSYICEHCQQNYREQSLCPTCGNPAQLIQGCGASNYFCPTEGLISSKKVIIHYLEKE